jgi:folate-binding protein YgfZ
MTQSTTPHLGFLCISGEGAKKFLQGQLTCNLDEITPETHSLAAHCNPQGRVISLFRIFLLQDQYFLQMPIELLETAQNALKKYAVFFKVSLAILPDKDHPLPISETWKADNIAAGIPSLYPETSEKFLPHELNLHKLEAISFNKGCFTGQEIIARMQYRGKLKNHLYRAKTTTSTPPTRGAEIFSQTHSAGYLVDYIHLGYNNYELLIIAAEAEINTTLFLDEERKIQLDILALPYTV